MLKFMLSIRGRHTLLNPLVNGRRYASTDQDMKAKVDGALLVNTLEVVKVLEETGIERQKAEMLATYIMHHLVLNTAKADSTYLSRSNMEKIMLEQEAKIIGFRSDLQRNLEVHHANVNKDIERQQSALEKIRAEVKHEIDKMTSSQRLEFNLEKGRMRDDLQIIRDKTFEVNMKVDRDINDLRAQLQKAKNDTMMSVITILGTFSAIAFTISRFLQMSGSS